ncbi:MAG TPA: protein kinase [Anaerolineales bacterium]|nr:protein kinase [Anaerolineales bacterium]
MDKFLARLYQVFQKNNTKTIPGVGAIVDKRYRLDAEIGRGGMGIVYRAYDIPNQREVAFKVINFGQANALTRRQFLQESEISARLAHPHIVAVHETGTIDAQESLPFIVMEWIQGTSLDQIRGLTYARIVEIGKQICEALEYAHNQGFVYRDLKPANVLLEKCGFEHFVKLTDFGLARPRGMAYLDMESNLAGSVFYLAPELIAGQPADVGSDLYALGVTLYEMITEHVPFSNFDEQSILAQHLEEAVTPPSQSRPDVPPALEAIVLRLLAKNPNDRFASAQEVHQALDQVPIALARGAALGNLPPLPTNVAGWEDEITQAIQLLESHQLVTMLGADASLALAIGAQLADQFADGAWYVDLQTLDDPGLVLETVVSVLGVCKNPQRPLAVTLVEYLREKNLLFLLNHCDHLQGACAQLAETILHACPDVRILATSHKSLNIPAEKCI